MSNNALLDTLGNVRGVKFASFVYRAKETDELARYTFFANVNLTNAYEADRDLLKSKLSDLTGIEKDAAIAILASLEESIEKGLGNNTAYTHGKDAGDTYIHFSEIPNLVMNKNDMSVRLRSILHTKTVLEKGNTKYKIGRNGFKRTRSLWAKDVNEAADMCNSDEFVIGEAVTISEPMTIAKNKVRKDLNLRTGRIREFLIPNVTTAAMNGEVLEIG
jgi:hypothetical protein